MDAYLFPGWQCQLHLRWGKETHQKKQKLTALFHVQTRWEEKEQFVCPAPCRSCGFEMRCCCLRAGWLLVPRHCVPHHLSVRRRVTATSPQSRVSCQAVTFFQEEETCSPGGRFLVWSVETCPRGSGSPGAPLRRAPGQGQGQGQSGAGEVRTANRPRTTGTLQDPSSLGTGETGSSRE